MSGLEFFVKQKRRYHYWYRLIDLHKVTILFITSGKLARQKNKTQLILRLKVLQNPIIFLSHPEIRLYADLSYPFSCLVLILDTKNI